MNFSKLDKVLNEGATIHVSIEVNKKNVTIKSKDKRGIGEDNNVAEALNEAADHFLIGNNPKRDRRLKEALPRGKAVSKETSPYDLSRFCNMIDSFKIAEETIVILVKRKEGRTINRDPKRRTKRELPTHTFFHYFVRVGIGDNFEQEFNNALLENEFEIPELSGDRITIDYFKEYILPKF